MRRLLLAVALLAAGNAWGRLPAATADDIIPETTAARHGLSRPWFTQVAMDRSRTRITDVVLHRGILYVVTDRAMIHVIDAETGQTLWAKQVGRPDHPSLAPAVGADLLAMVNGSRLYVCNRFNGDLLYEVEVGGAPGAGPCMTQVRSPKVRVYVPLVSGRVLAYCLELSKGGREQPAAGGARATPAQVATPEATPEATATPILRLKQEYPRPLSCHSEGRALIQPLLTREAPGEEFVAWATDLGYLNVGLIDSRTEASFSLRYRLETGAAIASRPSYLPANPNDPTSSGIIFVTSRDGDVYAVEERDGKRLWRYPTGEPMIEPAAVIGRRLYVATQPGGMFCLNALVGEPIWWTPEVRHFVAASQDRIYASDQMGRIFVLSAETGTRLDTIAAGNLPIKVANTDTDRLYLATDTGLIQCLREAEQIEPFHHGDIWQEQAEPDQPAAVPPPDQGADAADSPFG